MGELGLPNVGVGHHIDVVTMKWMRRLIVVENGTLQGAAREWDVLFEGYLCASF